MIVVDASVLANVVGDDDEAGHLARRELRQHQVVSAPDLVDVETVAVLRKRWLAGTLRVSRFSDAIDDLADLPVDRYPTGRLMRRAYELRENVTVYDATYVALAETLECELLTADRKLASTPSLKCEVRVIG